MKKQIFFMAIISCNSLSAYEVLTGVARKGTSDYYYLSGEKLKGSALTDLDTLSVKSCKLEKQIKTDGIMALYSEGDALFVIGPKDISVFNIKNPIDPVLIGKVSHNLFPGKVSFNNEDNIIRIEGDINFGGKGKEYTFNPQQMYEQALKQQGALPAAPGGPKKK